jgi:hypothetical protein
LTATYHVVQVCGCLRFPCRWQLPPTPGVPCGLGEPGFVPARRSVRGDPEGNSGSPMTQHRLIAVHRHRRSVCSDLVGVPRRVDE